jgi:hypothetical protein
VKKALCLITTGFFLLVATSYAKADATIGTSTTDAGSAQKPMVDDEVYDQLISISAGAFSPQSAVVSNGTYTFNYGSGTTDTFLIQAGWAVRLMRDLYLAENIAYSRFSGSASAENLSVNLVGLDSRLQFALDNSPIPWFIPFVEGGYLYTFYSQTGSSDLDSVQGGTGNFVMGAGARIWVNRSSSLNTDLKGTYSRLPLFLTVKWNSILSNGSAFNLADNGLMVGVSVGL